MAKSKNQAKKSRKKLWIILGIVAVIIVLLVFFVVRAIGNFTTSITESFNSNKAPVEKGEIEVITEGIGVVETKESIQEVVDYNVKVKMLYKKNGEQAAAGEAIAEFESIITDESISQLETQLSDVDSQLSYSSKSGSTSVKSPVAGRIKRINVEKESSVLTVQEEKKFLMEISADGKMKVEFESSMPMSPGERIQVIYGEEHVDGRVQSSKGNLVTVAFDDSDKYDVDVEVAVVNEEGTQIGTGLTMSGHPVYITANSGVVESINVSLNDKISAGKILMKLKDVNYSDDYVNLLELREELTKKIEKAKEYKAGYVITAPFDCIVNELTVKEGDSVVAGTPFCKMLDTSAFQVVLGIDELDIQGIEQGQKVEITVDAIENEIYDGEVSSVSLSGENTNGVASYQVSVMVNEAKGLLPGMSANGKITIDKKTDALLVPIDAVSTVNNEKKVTVVKDDNTTEERTVKLGLVNNSSAEVLEGLEEGEQVQLIVKIQDIYSQMGITVEE